MTAMHEKIYDLEDRLVRFAGEIILFVMELEGPIGRYYQDQLSRSGGGSALNYGEVQASPTDKDFVYRCSVVLRELKESRVSLKILDYIDAGDTPKRKWLLQECEELVAIMVTRKTNRETQMAQPTEN